MIASDLLLVGAEVSVAFAGFSGIIATFQFRDRTRIKRGDVVALTMIVQLSLLCALMTVFPLLLSLFEFEDSTIWGISSAVLATIAITAMYSIDKGMRNAVRKTSLRLLFGTMQGIAGLFSLSLILNAVDVFFHREPGPYTAAIIWGLTLVGYMFGRLMLRPLWRSVRLQETETLNGTNPG